MIKKRREGYDFEGIQVGKKGGESENEKPILSDGIGNRQMSILTRPIIVLRVC